MRDGYIRNKLFYLLASLPLLMGKMLGAETTPPPPPPTPSNYYNGEIKPLGTGGPGVSVSPIDNYIIYLLIFAVLLIGYFSYRMVQKKKALHLSADCDSQK